MEVAHCSQGGLAPVGLGTESSVRRKGEFKVSKMEIKALRIIRRMAYLSGDREDGKSGNLDRFG